MEQAADAREMPLWRSYVALGDSFTEGLNDVDPAHPERFRGWADLLAQSLAQQRSGAGGIHYANLAIRGRLLRQIITEQVPQAVQMRPDLTSLVGGGNDILRRTADVDSLLGMLEDAVVTLRAAGIDVLLGTGVDPAHAPLVRATRSRVGLYNAGIWSIARRQGAFVLDLWGMASIKDWRMWASDRIHLNTDGHTRVAQAALVGLGLPPGDGDWDTPLQPAPAAPRRDRMRSNVQWAREHVGPWVGRRLRRRSSGDGLLPKYPDLAGLDPADSARQ